jgi:hypothetical protein
MTTPPEKPKTRINPLLDDEEIRIISEPVKPRVMPSLVEKHMQSAEQKRVSAAEELPPPPQWPMLSGILTFPFYLNTLNAWMFITMGLMVTSWLFMFWMQYGAMMGAQSARLLGLPTCLAGVLTFGYAATCCLTIIEDTSNGWDTIEVSPGMEWKEWIWNFAHIATLALQAAMVGYVVQLISSSNSSLPMVVATYVVFPMVLLGALAADGAWVPLAIGTVLRSLVQVWWAWGLFFLEITPMAVVWTILTKKELAGDTPWLVPLYAAPFLAVIILIYARLTGRLAGCIAANTAKPLSEGDDDEDS